MNRAKIIAVDFDGTLFTNYWPNIGAPIWETINKLQEEQEAGAKTILWTCRVGEALEHALAVCADHKIHFDAVNENLPEVVEAFGSDTRKIFADEYWDDRAVTRPGDIKNEDLTTWISVQERLPADGETVLITLKIDWSWGQGTKSEYVVCEGDYTTLGGYIPLKGDLPGGFDTFNDWDEGQPIFVLAWCPMPQPFKD